MKIKLLISFFVAATAGANDALPIFNHPIDFYKSKENSIFANSTPVALSLNSSSDDFRSFTWEGGVNGKVRRIEINIGSIWVDGQNIKFDSVSVFPKEPRQQEDYPIGVTAYFVDRLVCYEPAISGSGRADRYQRTYLIKQDKKNKIFAKLPSLFGGCLSLHFGDKGQVLFYQVEYIYGNGDDPMGLVFNEYEIKGREFIQTGNQVKAEFIEPENVFKFRVVK